MWNRRELKEKAKAALKINYWKAVLVSLIFVWVAGGAPSSTATFELSSVFGNTFEEESYDIMEEFEDHEAFEDFIEEDIYFESDEELIMMVGIILLVFVVVIFIIGIIAVVVSLIWTALIANPVEMGCGRFFLLNLKEKTDVKEILHAFDSNYKNVMKVMFFRTLFTMLWSMLFWIPGIIKSYEYRMIPYLLAENPNLSKDEAFELSRRMMDGNKWKAFVLDWSFFLWDMLSVATFGLVEIFYVAPYRNLTNAALYEKLSQVYTRPNYDSYTQAEYYTNPGNIPPQPSHVEVNPYVNPTQFEEL